MALGWQPIERGEWREQMLFAQPPSLSLGDQCQAGGMGRGEDGGRVAFGKLAGGGSGGGSWVRPGWAVPALAAASPLCHLSHFSPHPLFLSFSLLHPQQTERKTGSSFRPPPTSARPPHLLPTTHHTIPPPSHLCSLLLARSPSFTRLRPHTKTGAMF